VTHGAGAALDDARLARWARQLLVPGFGEAAQRRLAGARVQVVGADAVAAGALVCLVQAGVGGVWIDDAEQVAPQDVGGWFYGPDAVGRPRAEVAAEALAALSRFTSVEPYPAGGVPTATLVAAPSVAQALHAAEAARRAGVPHAVLDPDADGGAVVSIPPGAPCYACARSTASASRPALPGAAALAALAAQELVQMIALPGSVPGRRLDLTRGVTYLRATARLAGCACGAAAASQGV
jgi:adenylyltransferase/sulfurtransferase